MPEENKVIPGHSEGDTGYLSGYIPTGDDRRIREVYRNWVHYNYGAHPSEGIDDGRVWKTRWQALAVMTARRYGAPSGESGAALCTRYPRNSQESGSNAGTQRG